MPWLEGPSGIVVAVVLGLGLLYLAVQLLHWHFRVALRLRLLELKDAELAERLASLRQPRSLDDELSQLLGKTISARLEALGAEELTVLDQEIRRRLPELVGPVLQNFPERFSEAVTAAVEESALAHLGDALATTQPRIGAALEQRVQAILADPENDVWEQIDAHLGRHLVGVAETLPAETRARLEARAGAALLSRADDMLASPDDFTDLFERLDAALQEQLLGTVAEAPEECLRALATRTAAGMTARVAEMFDNPSDHETLFESLDEKLGERILEVAGDLPEETARNLDERIGAELLAELDHICENTGEYTDLYESIDEKLGGRLLELATVPPPELGQRLAERFEAGLLAELDHLLADRDEQEELFSDLDEKLGQHLRRKLRDELSGGRGGRVEAALDEFLRARARARLQATDLTELDRLLDQRVAALRAGGPETAARLDERLREELAARAAERNRQSDPGPARPLAQQVEEWVGAALDQARPALRHALESWLGRQAEAPEAGDDANRDP